MEWAFKNWALPCGSGRMCWSWEDRKRKFVWDKAQSMCQLLSRFNHIFAWSLSVQRNLCQERIRGISSHPNHNRLDPIISSCLFYLPNISLLCPVLPISIFLIQDSSRIPDSSLFAHLFLLISAPPPPAIQPWYKVSDLPGKSNYWRHCLHRILQGRSTAAGKTWPPLRAVHDPSRCLWLPSIIKQ